MDKGLSWGRLGTILGPSWAFLGPSWDRLGANPRIQKTYKNQGFGTILERRCSKMLCFTMVFEHFYLSDVLTFLGPVRDRLGRQLPEDKNYQKNTWVFATFGHR